jgi:hypothetical protein
MTKRLQVYDPRRGDDRLFRFRSKESVSSLSNGFWICETSSLDWRPQAALLDQTFAAMRGQGYLTYLPWAPDDSGRAARFQSEFVRVNRVPPGALLVAQVDSGDGLVTRMLQEHAAFGGRGGGLWSTGVAGSIAELEAGLQRIGEEADSPILASAANLSAVQCALCLDDGIDMILLRLAVDLEDTIDMLLANTGSSQSPSN